MSRFPAWGWPALGAVLWTAGCGTVPVGSTRTTEVAVQPACPQQYRPCTPPTWLAGLSRGDEAAARTARDAAFERYLASGSPEDRRRALATALVSPPDPDRDGRLAEVLERDPAGKTVAGWLADLDRALLRAFDARVRGLSPAPESGPSAEADRRIAELERQLTRARAQVQNLQLQAQARDARVRALERQIEELKSIEQIIDQREKPRPTGGNP